MKSNIQNTLNRIVNLREKAAKEKRYKDALLLFEIQNKLIRKIIDGRH